MSTTTGPPGERAVLQPDRAKFLEQPAAHLLWRQSLRQVDCWHPSIEIASASAAPAGTNLRAVRTSSIESSLMSGRGNLPIAAYNATLT